MEPRTGRTALILAVVAIGAPLVAVLIGVAVSAAGPGGDTDASWAPLLLPILALVVAVPAWIVSVVFAIVALARRTSGRVVAGVAIALDALSVLPFLAYGIWALVSRLGLGA